MIAPHSLEELSHGLTLPDRRIAPIVKELLAAGAIITLEGRDDEGHAVYAPIGYVESAGHRDYSDVIFSRDYGGQYEAPIWRDEF